MWLDGKGHCFWASKATYMSVPVCGIKTNAWPHLPNHASHPITKIHCSNFRVWHVHIWVLLSRYSGKLSRKYFHNGGSGVQIPYSSCIACSTVEEEEVIKWAIWRKLYVCGRGMSSSRGLWDRPAFLCTFKFALCCEHPGGRQSLCLQSLLMVLLLQLSDGGDLIDEILFIPRDKLRKPSYAVKTPIFSGSPSWSLYHFRDSIYNSHVMFAFEVTNNLDYT